MTSSTSQHTDVARLYNEYQGNESNIVFIWLDNHCVSVHEQSEQRLGKFTQLLKNVLVFDDIDECVDFVTELDDQLVFLVVTEVVGQQLIPHIHAVPQICSIFVLSQGSAIPYPTWTESWSKIKAVTSDIESICEKLQLLQDNYRIDSTPVTFIPTSELEDVIDLDRIDPTFMYTQLFKKVILEMKHDKESRVEFLEYCREKYIADTVSLRKIEDFVQNYESENAIFWYTLEPIIYEELNHSLRLLRADRIIDMRFFIHDLHYQLDQLHKTQVKPNQNQSFKVYRGQRLSLNDFEKLRKSIGGLVAFNCFLSTSHDRAVSELFWSGIAQIEGIIGILYVITVHPNSTTVPFANVQANSNVPDEEELLFSMHAIFRIKDIIQKPDAKNLYEVHVESTKDIDPKLNQLMQKVRLEVNRPNKWATIKNLLMQVAQPERARRIVNQLLEKTTCPTDQADLYNELGSISYSTGDYNDALEEYARAVSLMDEHSVTDSANLVGIFMNIGLVYHNLGDYSKALSNFVKSHKELEKMSPNDQGLAVSHCNIGYACSSLGNHTEALTHYKKALELWKRCLPSIHYQLARIYNNIATTFQALGNYAEALRHYKITEDILNRSQPASHPNRGFIYDNLGNISFVLGDYQKALHYYETAHNIFRESLQRDHSHLAQSYYNIGTAYSGLGNHLKALSYFEEAENLLEKLFHNDHPDLATVYSSIGKAKSELGDYDKAMCYAEKVLAIRRKSLPSNHLGIAHAHISIGILYHQLGEYIEALTYLRQALRMMMESLGESHPELAQAHGNIGNVYYALGQYSEALSHYEKAHSLFKAFLPHSHPLLASSHNNMGTVYFSLGKALLALPHHEKALAIRLEVLRADHPHLAYSERNLGNVCLHLGQSFEALEHYKKALAIDKKKLPKIHPDLAQSHISVGNAYFCLNEYEEALIHFEKAQTSFPESYRNHPDFAKCLNNVGSVYSALGRHDQALNRYARAHKIFMMSLPGDHSDLAKSYINTADALCGLEKYSEALEQCRNALAILEGCSNTKTVELARIYRKMGELCIHIDDYHMALIHCEQARKLFVSVEEQDTDAISAMTDVVAMLNNALFGQKKA